MTELVWKVRVAVLWIFLSVAVMTSLLVFIYEPGTVRGIIRGEVEGVDLASAQALMYIALQPLMPMAMAFTTLALNDRRTNRSVNGVLGLITAVQSFFVLLQDFSDPSAFAIAVIFLVSLLLLWHVWKWPVPDKAASTTHEDSAVGR
jgi:O-antigen/teichoic acid export membrane protein